MSNDKENERVTIAELREVVRIMTALEASLPPDPYVKTFRRWIQRFAELWELVEDLDGVSAVQVLNAISDKQEGKA